LIIHHNGNNKMSNTLSQKQIPKQYLVSLIYHNDIKRKSYDLNPESDLYKVLQQITISLSKLINYSAPFNNKFHVEVTKNPYDVNTKESFFKMIHGHVVDLSDQSIWCTLGGAFVMKLTIDKNLDPFHITVAHFKTHQNCIQHLATIQKMVISVMNEL
jgi:hypothetical protein